MFKFGTLIICASFILQTVSLTAVTEPVIKAVDLSSFGSNVESIVSSYNSSWFIVGKCCPIGQILQPKNDGGPAQCEIPNTKVVFSPFFTKYNETGMILPPKTSAQFIAIVGNPCKYERYALEPEADSQDDYNLLANGSIYMQFDNVMLAPGRDYCMEFLPGRNLTAFICSSELRVVTADTRLAFYTVGLILSVPFLLATIISYSLTRQLRDVYGMSLCCYSGCLAVAFLSLAILQLGGHKLGEGSCIALGFVIQFAFVACFFWLNTMSIEMWQLVKQYGEIGAAIREGRPHHNRTFFYYSLWGWGFPAALIIVTIILDLSPTIPWTYVKRSGNEVPNCWFGFDKGALPWFYGPVGLLVFLKVVLFTITGFKIARTQRDLDLRRLARNELSDREDRCVFRELRLTYLLTLILFVIMAVNWSMELVSMLSSSELLAWSIFDLVNALQGILVFGLFVLRKPARTFVWLRIKKLTGTSPRESSADRINEMTLLPATNNGNDDVIFSPRRMNQ
ncbi:G-protein coupled receptor Mth2-like isoform X1 [Athalia rosae]|uniref:G-protein coupled receptor Mth2-like isoform X1 n=2 Tax=Athalia rosae TaxID=37344 RepID=UPI002033E239|nr:G-protein coupled receptor Mth2-like isoform X1 [Athalia rosae]